MESPAYQIESVLFDTATLQHRISELGTEISNHHADGVTLIGILTGALYFLADLSRTITCPVKIDLISVASYAGTESSGTVTLLKDLDRDISDQHVIIVEDIVDTGRTLNTLLALLANRHPASLRVCTLLNKPDRRVVPVSIDYCGFTIPDKFVVGYGLDHNQAYRNLPYIATLT